LALIPSAWVSDPPGKPNAMVVVPIFSQEVVFPAAIPVTWVWVEPVKFSLT